MHHMSFIEAEGPARHGCNPGDDKPKVAPRRNGLVGAGIDLISHPTSRKGLLSLIDQMIVSLSNFLSGVIVGRACGAEEFGLYSLGFSLLLCAAHVQGARAGLEKLDSGISDGAALQ
jgi:hypothetical protein